MIVRDSIFCSRHASCKMPFGAVRAEDTVTFHIFPAREMGVTQAHLVIALDGHPGKEIPFSWMSLEEGRDKYMCRFRPLEQGIYWYYFRMKTVWGEQIISRGAGGMGIVNDALTANFQLTVTGKNYHSPRWFGEGITYNIFPDRFHRLEVPKAEGYRNARRIHENWEDTPEWRPDENGEILNNDFFGGSFAGIEEKLPYLKSLNVTTIYLNPIFEAASNHRYDTGDYKKPDPMLGTEKDFKRLCAAAHRLGMRIVLDGVFSHTGYDSRYFNARGHYESVGAHQSQQSPYYDWYEFNNWPDEYSSWWGIYTLPQVNELNPKYLHYISDGPNSVVRHWLRLGASGWRLDVADELPDEFIKHLNKACREVREDALVLGEVWEDASNKISYGVRRQYFEGGELDSVMNYPLRDAVMAYLGGGPAEHFEETMETIRENYPREVFYNLMNIIGTHDTPRVLTVLGSDPVAWQADKDYRAYARLEGEALRLAKRKLFLAAVLQFTMPGSPCIYYGDEAGMQGYEDPLNRGTYPWGKEDEEVLAFYKTLTRVRTEYEPLKKGELRFLIASGSILVFKRSYREEEIVTLINRDKDPREITLPYSRAVDLLTGITYIGQDRIHVRAEGLDALILACSGTESIDL